MTVGLVETLHICNSKYNYQPVFMNPKRELTQPSEGVFNNGFDNADSDYILRVSDLISSPEGKE
jgi:dual specificity protein kinase YAK1